MTAIPDGAWVNLSGVQAHTTTLLAGIRASEATSVAFPVVCSGDQWQM
jgi:hypothetical protein